MISVTARMFTRENNASHHVTSLHDEFLRSSDLKDLGRLRSASLISLIVCRTRLLTVADRAFPVAAAPRVWNELPRRVTVPSMWQSSQHSCFSRSFPDFCSACGMASVNIRHFNRCCYLLTNTYLYL